MCYLMILMDVMFKLVLTSVLLGMILFILLMVPVLFVHYKLMMHPLIPLMVLD